MTTSNADLSQQHELIPLSEDPLCRESVLTSLDTWITPVERFYIRNHFSEIPAPDMSTWRLEINGEVRQPLSLSFDDLLALPARELAMTMECAGNSRSYVTPPAEGLTFRHGAVSTARWKGVPLSVILLDEARLKSTAREITFKGADHGEEEEEGIPLRIDYQRSLPLDKALHPDTILAYEMNGQPLPPAHGYPLRLIVPGWYGMASVKWLVNVHASAESFQGFFQKRRYVFINEGVESPASLDRAPVTTLKVKSLITSPRHGEVIPQGPITIRGLAWSGQGEVRKVEVSTEESNSWQEAKLIGESVPNTWRMWEHTWDAFQPGHYIIMVRATDSSGNTQPASIPWNFRGYANNSIHTIAVEVPHRGKSH